MKAEREDAPPRIQHRQQSSPWRLLAILGAGAAITWAGIALWAKPVTIDVQQQATHIEDDRNAKKARALQQLLEQERRNAPTPTPAGERQTVFNAQNYRPPRTDINTMDGVKLAIIKPEQEHSSRAAPKREHVQDVWPGGLLTWTVEDGQIDPNTVCAQEKYGSLRYRDCRKAAKETFKRRCEHGDQASCHATTHFRPLG